MHTPWGEIAVADAHVHCFSHRFLGLLATQMAQPEPPEEMCRRLAWQAPPETAEQFAAQWVVELDRHQVARVAFISSARGDEESVLAASEAFPGRFLPWFFVNPAEPGAAANCEAWLKRGMQTLCLFPAMHAYPLTDPRVDEVLQVAAAAGANVFVHCGVLSVGIRKKLGLPSPFDMRYSNPIDLHGLALRYSRLSFIVPHFGAGYLREALMLADLCPNVHLDTSSSNSWMRYHAPDLTLEHVFERALDVAGPSRLLFGSDSSFFPRGWHRQILDRQIAALRLNGINADAARQILGGNLLRLHKIS
jgi:predicted TIM-barrel fold metal-dependent hydrolase